MATGFYGFSYATNDGVEVDSISTNVTVSTTPGDKTLMPGEPFSVIGPTGTTSYIYSGTDDSGGVFGTNGNAEVYITNSDQGAAVNEPWAFEPSSDNDVMICFAEGTLIATPNGEKTVETLAIGDEVLTADGRTVAVKWIGHQTVLKLFTPAERFRPVCISAGALGDGVPHTDLVVTKDHGLIVDGVIVHAGALVNGTTITEVSMAELSDQVTYWHVETECHEAILANGAAAESYIDNVGRHRFANYGEFEARYGVNVPEMVEMDLPRAATPRQLPRRVRDRLADREVALGLQCKKSA